MFDNYICFVILIIIFFVICYFLYRRKKTNFKNIQSSIFAHDSNKNFVYVGDVCNFDYTANKNLINIEDIEEDKIYLEIKKNKLEYKGEIIDLKPIHGMFPKPEKCFYLLTNKIINNKHFYIIQVAQK